MKDWRRLLRGDPLPWLLEEEHPATRHRTLRLLLGRPEDDPEVARARAMAMEADPIRAILEAQHPNGYWVKPGPGYGPKYLGTVWQLIFLDQLGADRSDPRVRSACRYILTWCPTAAGGFGCSAAKAEAPPPPSAVIHCLNGNLLHALIGFGWLDDERVQGAIDWQARSITGEGFGRYYASGTSGPTFACAANEKLPCAWGAVKAMLALARIPEDRRAPHVRQAIDQGVEFLLSRDPAVADYPAGWGNQKPSTSWFKLGFPQGYVADLLQNLQALAELGMGGDPRLLPSLRWLLSRQDEQGRWKNQYGYNGKTWVDFEKQGQISKTVTLRACHLLSLLPGETIDALA